ncbi:cysteine hydrolase [Eubacteriales bacterium OttesenSCG-928-N13]|nr:cysteine hydrolase [Eubacteriales bacterium OttesenSCG-928-N13]
MSKVLVVVDMQNDFITGALGTPEARAIVPAVVDYVKQAKEAGDSVIFTLDTHSSNYLRTAEGRALPVEHCIQGTKGHDLIDPLKDLTEGARVAEKPTFGSLWLMGELAGMARAYGTPEGDGIDVEFCGVCTDICVVTNALLVKTRLPEAKISVLSKLCAGASPEKHKAALTVMESCQINIIK